MVVLANGGRVDVTVWGDLLSAAAAARGIGGTVVDGAIRDLARIRHLGYPLFSAAVHMRTGKDRVYAADYGATVRLSGVEVSPGDTVVGDHDGVVVIPDDRVNEVTVLAQQIHEAELEIERLIAAGVSLGAAREKVGYHTLQRTATT